MSDYRLSADAGDDLEAIVQYIGEDNPQRALSFVDELISTFDTIAERPNSFPVAAVLPGQVRSALHGRYRIFFELTDGVPHILRVVHGARDIPALFSDK